jgi:hypothetical protein
MGDIFTAISSGFARFVFAWVLPSLVTVGVFAIFLWPEVQSTSPLRPISRLTAHDPTAGAIVLGFFVAALAVTFAYASLPIYQLLEGYTLPRFLRRPLLRRQQRKFTRVRALQRRFAATGVLSDDVTVEDFQKFPESLEDVRATSLGNALTAMETWAVDRYQLDSQTMWHELHGVSRENIRLDTEEGRAPVDFFVSSIAHMALLFGSCVDIAALIPRARTEAIVIGALALLIMPASYRLAVRNVIDWAQSVKAMVNLGRLDLAAALGLSMPATLEEEQEMWKSHYWAIELNQASFLPSYNSFRRPVSTTSGPEGEAGTQPAATPKPGA